MTKIRTLLGFTAIALVTGSAFAAGFHLAEPGGSNGDAEHGSRVSLVSSKTVGGDVVQIAQADANRLHTTWFHSKGTSRCLCNP
jgi:hypothetical protein